MSSAYSTIPTPPAGGPLQLSRRVAEILNFFQQISLVFTQTSPQDALQMPVQARVTGGKSSFVTLLIVDSFHRRSQRIFFYSAASSRRVTTVGLSPDTGTRASIESQAAR